MSLTRYARPAAFVLLVGVTIYGIHELVHGDFRSIAAFWRGKLALLPLILLLAALDVALEGVAWMWVYERFRIRALDGGGTWAFLSGRAGLLLPAQLGRLLRPDAMVRLNRGKMVRCLKAEAVVFVLDSTSVAALLIGLLAFLVHPLLAPVASLIAIAVALLLGNRVANMLSSTRLALPSAFWWQWQTLGIILVEMAGWLAHGLAFYAVVCDLPGDFGWWDGVFFGPASAVLGVGTGLPGGIGATEGFLGSSLRLLQVPSDQLALVVAAFRTLTFWVWIPVGWFALVAIRGRVARLRKPTPDTVPAVADRRLVAAPK